jgi:hypothetical protein
MNSDASLDAERTQPQRALTSLAIGETILIDPEELARVFRRLASQTPEELRAAGFDPEDVAARKFVSADAAIRFYEILRDLAPTDEERARSEVIIRRLLRTQAERKR